MSRERSNVGGVEEKPEKPKALQLTPQTLVFAALAAVLSVLFFPGGWKDYVLLVGLLVVVIGTIAIIKNKRDT